MGWIYAGCPLYPQTCGGYAGGWFMWALRDAVASDGKYTNGAVASAFYQKVADEVDAACHSKALECYFNPVPFMPHLHPDELRQIGPELKRAAQMLSFIQPPSVIPADSLGFEDQIRNAAAFLNIENHTPPPAAASYINPKLIRDALHLKAAIVRGYGVFLPFVLSLGFGSLLLVAVRSVVQRRLSAGFVIALACWMAVIARTMVLILIDISSFPALSSSYLNFAYPLSCYASLVSIFVVFREASHVEAGGEI